MDRYGNKAKDLVQELKRSDWLPPYNVRCVDLWDNVGGCQIESTEPRKGLL